VYTMNNKKIPTNIRLTPHAKRLAEAMAEAMGITITSVIEISIREKAKRDGEDAEETESKE